MRCLALRDNDVVAIVSHRLVDEARIRSGVKKAQRALSPDVVRIMYSVDDDWTGEESLFFRIVLSDKASEPGGLSEITKRVSDRILREVHAYELGLQAYFNFRSQSEQAELRDPTWER